MGVYIPFWSIVKIKPSVNEDTSLSRFLVKRYLNLIDAVVRRKAYFTHPENILLSMILILGKK